ncbi:MAG: hypothetical protein ACJ74U_16210 [Jatrophihabitantaceae bacterium]
MSYSFRIHLSLGRRGHVNEQSHELILQSEDGRRVKLRAAVDNEFLANTNGVILTGSGYPDEDTALSEAERWRTALLVGFAYGGIGADVGARQEGVSWGSYSDEGKMAVRQLLNIPDDTVVFQDRPGVIVFPTTPNGRFVRLSAVGKKSPLPDQLVDSIRRAYRTAPLATPAELLAFNLFNESLNLDTPDVRFVCLMMAIECLLDAEPRGMAATSIVDNALHEASMLPDSDLDKASLIGSLRHLKQESIAATGRELVAKLEGLTTYQDESPVKFFNKCYEIRSQLVHGHTRAPSRQEVDLRAAGLEVLVADLLSLPVLGLQPGRAANSAP